MSRDALIEKFRNVGLERIEQMNSLLVELERTPDDEEGVDELMREIHTLKGEAKMMGFADINLVAHQTENLLLAIVDDGVITDTEPVNLVFEGLDLMRDLLTKSAGEASAELDLTGFVDRVGAYQGGGDETPDAQGDSASTADAAPTEEGEGDAGDSGGESVDDVSADGAGDDDAGHADSGERRGGIEDGDGDDEGETGEGSEVGVEASGDSGSVKDTKHSDDADEIRPEPVSTHTRIDTGSGDGNDSSGQHNSSGRKDGGSLRIQTSSSLRVDVDKLERLGDIAGETLLMSRRLDYHLDELEGLREQLRRQVDDVDDLGKEQRREFRDLVHRIDSCETSLRDEAYLVNLRASQVDDKARHLRHIPLSQVLSHYPRAVRDLADTQGKQVRMIHTFGSVEVDRTILTALSEPLLHLVRNAVDHGIESPDERVDVGKSPEGEIELTAEYFGDSIRVELRDDGRGIDPDVIRTKAVERDYLSSEKAERLSDQEAIALIFESGFTTRQEATDVSGRGVGMDVVRRQITEIGGFIEVESEVGQGTVFTLNIPVSSAINSVLVFLINDRNFALTAKDVERVVMVEQKQLETVHGGVCLRLEGELVPLVDWAGLLELDHRGDPPDRMTALLVRKGQRRVAVWVDDVVGEQEAISRPLDDFLSGVALCRGVALTDSGAVVPLLNVMELMERSAGEARLDIEERRSTQQSRSFTAVQGREAADVRTILVAEDSEVTRSLVVSILKNRDYRVLEADDGHHAWERLKRHNVDLVLTDIQMPRTSGLELLNRIRNSEDYATLPVVILTTLGDSDVKKKAMSLGANGYLVKLSFQEEELIETVRRYIG